MGKYPKIFLYFLHKMTCKFLSEYYNSYGELIPILFHYVYSLRRPELICIEETTFLKFTIRIQKRSLDRELYPGKYDLIQTTHFDPDESYEEAIVDSLEYYRGLKKSKEDIIHVGSTHQQIDAGDYHDNALVQVFAIFTAKALFIMPDTEEIVKVRFEDFRQLIHGKQNTIKLYSLDDVYLKESSADEWWLRKDEFIDVVEPYIDSRIEEI